MMLRLFRKLPTSVGDFLKEAPLPQSYRALVTSLDSSAETLKAMRFVISQDFGYLVNGYAALLPSELKIAISTPGVFVHFDEVWLFHGSTVQAPDPDLSLVAPLDLKDEEIEQASKWMRGTGCFAGFGDGEGLNALVLESQIEIIESLVSLQ